MNPQQKFIVRMTLLVTAVLLVLGAAGFAAIYFGREQKYAHEQKIAEIKWNAFAEAAKGIGNLRFMEVNILNFAPTDDHSDHSDNSDHSTNDSFNTDVDYCCECCDCDCDCDCVGQAEAIREIVVDGDETITDGDDGQDINIDIPSFGDDRPGQFRWQERNQERFQFQGGDDAGPEVVVPNRGNSSDNGNGRGQN